MTFFRHQSAYVDEGCEIGEGIEDARASIGLVSRIRSLASAE